MKYQIKAPKNRPKVVSSRTPQGGRPVIRSGKSMPRPKGGSVKPCAHCR